jgi:hypothetical protein
VADKTGILAQDAKQVIEEVRAATSGLAELEKEIDVWREQQRL